jgi:hypothetical protein
MSRFFGKVVTTAQFSHARRPAQENQARSLIVANAVRVNEECVGTKGGEFGSFDGKFCGLLVVAALHCVPAMPLSLFQIHRVVKGQLRRWK